MQYIVISFYFLGMDAWTVSPVTRVRNALPWLSIDLIQYALESNDNVVEDAIDMLMTNPHLTLPSLSADVDTTDPSIDDSSETSTRVDANDRLTDHNSSALVATETTTKRIHSKNKFKHSNKDNTANTHLSKKVVYIRQLSSMHSFVVYITSGTAES